MVRDLRCPGRGAASTTEVGERVDGDADEAAQLDAAIEITTSMTMGYASHAGEQA